MPEGRDGYYRSLFWRWGYGPGEGGNMDVMKIEDAVEERIKSLKKNHKTNPRFLCHCHNVVFAESVGYCFMCKRAGVVPARGYERVA